MAVNDQHIFFHKFTLTSRESTAVTELHIPVTVYPIVSLDKSDLVSTTCNYASTSMMVSFKDDESWAVASTDWVNHPKGLYLVSYVAGCGRGLDTLERSFHFVSSMELRHNDRKIVCAISPVEFKDVVHPDHDFEVQAGTFSRPSIKNRRLWDSSPPNKRQFQDDPARDPAFRQASPSLPYFFPYHYRY
jgi:hypothetical protein